MRIRDGDVALNVVEDGPADAPPLLVMHGILGSAETWDWMVPRVEDRFRVLRLEFRGHGESDRAPGAYDMEHYVSDAVAVCEEVAGAPCAVIGHSLGGGTAAGLAQTRPDLTRGILLEDAPLVAPAELLGTGHALIDTFVFLRAQLPQLQSAGTTVEEMAALVAAGPAAGGGTAGEVLTDDGIRAMASGLLRVDAPVLDSVIDGTQRPVLDLDRPIEVPVVAIAADPSGPDTVTRAQDLARLAATSPHVEAHTLEGANHLIHDTRDQREVFWSIVDDFLDRL